MESTDPDDIFEEAERLCLLATEDPSKLEDYRLAQEAAEAFEHNGWKRRTGMAQTDIIMKHMDTAGSISAREAMIDYGITSATLARRICDLEERGHDIVRERRTHPITKRAYTRYSLTEAV